MNPERYDIVRRIAGPRSFSQWVFLPILITLSAGTSVPQLQFGADAFYAWNSVAAVALAMSWSFAFVAGLLVNLTMPKPGRPRFVAVIVVFFVTEAGRAVFVGWQAQLLGLEPDLNLPYRIVAGGLTGLALFGLAAFLANETEEYRSTLGDLLQSKLLLAEMVTATASDLEVQRAKLLEQVRTAVTDSIRGVLSSGGASARDVADELVRVSEEVVRPLSHSLIPSSDPVPVRESNTQAQISFRNVMNYATYVRPFRPEAVTVFTLLLTLGAVIFEWPVESLPGFVALLLWVYGYLALMRLVVTPRLKAMRVAVRVVTLLNAYLGFVVVPGLAVLIATNAVNVESWPYFIYIVLIGQIVLWPLAMIAGVREARASVITDTLESTARLAWTRARLSSYLWGQQSTLAVALHKDVQGTLMAAAMKLKMSRDSGKNDAKAIDEIRATVLEAAEFVVAPVDAHPIAQTVDDLNQRWLGVFRIDMSGSDEAIARLDADPVCLRIVADMLAELVTNAVKHGQATSTMVELELVQSDVIRVSGVNNGRSLSAKPGFGLGSRMLEAVSLAQGFENVPGGVRVWADIPLV